MDWLKPEDWLDLRQIAFWFAVIVASNIVFEAFLLWRKGERPFIDQLKRMRGFLQMAPFVVVMLSISPVQSIMERHGFGDWRSDIVALLLIAVPTLMLLWRSQSRQVDQKTHKDT